MKKMILELSQSCPLQTIISQKDSLFTRYAIGPIIFKEYVELKTKMLNISFIFQIVMEPYFAVNVLVIRESSWQQLLFVHYSIYSIPPIKRIKMETHPYAGSYAESLNFMDQEIRSQPSAYKVNVVSFKQIARCSSRQFSDFGDLNMDDLVHHEPIISDAKAFKCFKCFGTKQKDLNLKVQQKCRECSGSQYIPEHHPIVAIMDQIIKKKMPHLSLKAAEQKRNESKRETLELQYGCRDVIKEQSFSYQQQSPPFCRNCNKQCDSNFYRSCQSCPDYNICETCYQKERFSHHHPLVLKDMSKMASRIMKSFSNMKKISEKVDSSESENYNQGNQGNQDQDLKCSNCSELIEFCYDACRTCQKRGDKYYVCSKCSEQRLYTHDPSHSLIMRTAARGGLHRIESAQSNKDDNLQINSLDNSGFKGQDIHRSLIRINHDFINQRSSQGSQKIQYQFGKESQEFHQEQININLSGHVFQSHSLTKKLSNTFQNDGQFDKIVRQKLLGSMHSIDSSLNGIELSSSLQYHRMPHNQEETQCQGLSFIPVFNNSTHELVQSPLKSNPEESYIFNDYQCDICGTQPIKNKRYHCNQCENFDLCEECYLIRSKKHQHRNFQQIDGRLLLKQRNQIIQLNQSKNIHINLYGVKKSLELRKTYK